MGSCVLRETIRKGRPRFAPRVSLSVYLSMYRSIYELTPLDIWIVSLRAGKNHRKGHDLRYEYLSWSDADSSRAFAAHR